jgi:predicted AlkP superfamily pyrophosphatase or phosphodiesterase
MTDEPMTSATVPDYGEGTLSDLANSLLASLGVNDAANPLGLASTRRACLLIVDGLGWELLRAHQAAAPFLSELTFTGRALTAGFPATTVTSLSSLGTGLPPGRHGMLGYQVAVPGQDRLLNGLRWDEQIDPVDWQPAPTIYQRAAAADIAAFRVAARGLEKTGFSLASMRGATYRPADSMGALVAQASWALADSDRALVTVYHPDLDGTGHVFGSQSEAWSYQLAHVDKMAEQLASSLPSGTVLYVTADHGMVDAAPDDKIDVDLVPGLGWRCLAASRGPGMSTPGPGRRATCWPPGRACSAVGPGWRPVTRPSRRAGSAPSSPGLRRGSGTWWRRRPVPGRSSRPRRSRWSPHSSGCTVR